MRHRRACPSRALGDSCSDDDDDDDDDRGGGGADDRGGVGGGGGSRAVKHRRREEYRGYQGAVFYPAASTQAQRNKIDEPVAGPSTTGLLGTCSPPTHSPTHAVAWHDCTVDGITPCRALQNVLIINDTTLTIRLQQNTGFCCSPVVSVDCDFVISEVL